MPWVAICERTRTRCGSNRDLTYVQVVANTQQLRQTASDYLAANPTHPWNDPASNEYIVDITDREADDIRNGTNPLFYQNSGNLPRWQNRNINSESAYDPGSFADPTSDASAFTSDVSLDDDRPIVRLYNGDPLDRGVQIGLMELNQDSFAGELVVHLRLFSSADVPSTINDQGVHLQLGTHLLLLNFTAGIATFGVRTTAPGVVTFDTNNETRVLTPSGLMAVVFRIFGTSFGPESG